MSELLQNEHSALMELVRATNLLLNEASGVADGGVTPATFDRAKRAYDSAIRVLNDPMRKLQQSMCKPRTK